MMIEIETGIGTEVVAGILIDIHAIRSTQDIHFTLGILTISLILFTSHILIILITLTIRGSDIKFGSKPFKKRGSPLSFLLS